MKCLLVIEHPVIKLSVIFIRKSDLNHDDLQTLYLIPIEQIGRFYYVPFFSVMEIRYFPPENMS